MMRHLDIKQEQTEHLNFNDTLSDFIPSDSNPNSLCKKDLLQLDFEGILKYFRVSLPKKCRNKDVARAVMKHACSLKVKKLKKYELEFMAHKEAEDNADTFTIELETVKTNLERTEEEKTRLEAELTQVKAMLKREVDRAEADARRSNDIIAEYKKINARLDSEQAAVKNRLLELRNEVSKCETCRQRIKDIEITSEKRSVQRITETDEPQLPRALERIRELELELAQTKLERVQAECWKQELTHQLHSTLAELQTAKTSWIHKTFSTIKDAAVNKKDGEVVANGPDLSENSEMMKRVFVTRRISREKDERTGQDSPRRSQTMETMSTKRID